MGAGTLGSSATWGITISALCLLALLIVVAIRYAQPRVFLKGSNKTAQGMRLMAKRRMATLDLGFENEEQAFIVVELGAGSQ